MGLTNYNAAVAELADAQCSGRCMVIHVQVRILPAAYLVSRNVDISTFLLFLFSS